MAEERSGRPPVAGAPGSDHSGATRQRGKATAQIPFGARGDFREKAIRATKEAHGPSCDERASLKGWPRPCFARPCHPARLFEMDGAPAARIQTGAGQSRALLNHEGHRGHEGGTKEAKNLAGRAEILEKRRSGAHEEIRRFMAHVAMRPQHGPHRPFSETFNPLCFSFSGLRHRG